MCPCSSEELSVLWSLGLVKHPQFMSCIYITLFLVTMLIIAQQVVFVSSSVVQLPPGTMRISRKSAFILAI